MVSRVGIRNRGCLIRSGKNMQEFDFQKRIRELMQTADITSHCEMARLCDVDPTTVTRWMDENHEFHFKSIKKICEGFGITYQEFFATDFVEQRGEGAAKKLRHIWKVMDETERYIFVESGVNVLEMIRRLFGDKDLSSLIRKR